MRVHPVLLLLPLALSTGADGDVHLGCGFGGGLGIVDEDGDGYGSTIDCDDSDPEIRPDADELCDGIDNDCDDDIDEDDAVDGTTWYRDGDYDGWGASDGDTTTACHQPEGYGPAGDCRDDIYEINPDADETCDGVDNDCDGTVDQDPVNGRTGCLDADGDGFGDPAICETACVLHSAFVEDDSDCDDSDPAVNPAAEEICDDIDNDCDGLTDPQSGDADGDGWDGCEGDCAPDDAAIHPDAAEICGDATDNNCDGSAGDCGVQGASSLGDHGLLLPSPLAYDALGTSVAGIGDLNGDGLADIALGAPYYQGTSSDAGAVYIVHGDPALRDEPTHSLDDSTQLLHGASASDQLGWSVAGVGDMDGDGRDDLLMGAPLDTTAGYAAGAAYLTSGAGVDSFDGSISAPEVAWVMYTSSYNDLLGWSVAGVGDVDGDGWRDLLLGAPQADGLAPGCGAAYLLRGPIQQDRDVADADASWSSDDLEDGVGISVAGVGDLNSDGLADLAIGAYRRDTTISDAGVVAVVLGRAELDGSQDMLEGDAQLLGTQTSAFAGCAVAAAGDVDGDGHDDLLVGARGQDFGLADAGGAYLIAGPVSGIGYLATKAVAELRGDQAYGYAGSSVAGVGDVNGDALADIAVGVPYADESSGSNAGRTAVFVGTIEGVHVLSEAHATLTGGANGQMLGSALDAAGDLDGDGYGDLLVGAPGYDVPSADAGAAWLIWGGEGL